MIFLDRSVPKSIADGLKQVRDDVRWFEDEFPHNTPDTEWLPVIGEREWLVILRDKKVRTRPAERQAINDGKVGCFVLTQKQVMLKWDFFRLIVCSLDEMELKFHTTSRPFIFGIGRTGDFRHIV